MPALTISQQTYRRYLMGQQGLWPGRRWRGAAGVTAALQGGCVLQVDPLNVAARSHDLALNSRVLDYSPELLDAALYTHRQGFDWGGLLLIHPMNELPYYLVAMERARDWPRRVAFARDYGAAIETVRQAVRDGGPLTGRSLNGKQTHRGSYRSSKDTGQALYHLWLTGELMTHSRRGFERVYDLFERVAPGEFATAASPQDTDEYFARRSLLEGGLLAARSFRNWFSGCANRPVTPGEAAERLNNLQSAGEVVVIHLESDPRNPRYLPAAQLAVLEDLHAGRIPHGWLPLETSTEEEMTPLAPLEIVSARGRAMPVFGFEYLWEVYKPAHLRRWGYYTLPLLYGDQLAARLDPKLDRAAKTLHILGFWLEEGMVVDERFKQALKAGLERLVRLAGAERLVCDADVPLP